MRFIKHIGIGKNKSSNKDLDNLQVLIKDALDQVKEPTSGKSLVALEAVKGIGLEGDFVRVSVELPRSAEAAMPVIREQAIAALTSITGITKAQVDFLKPAFPKNQTERKNSETRAALGDVRNIIGIASGKGGVGKSTTTVNLAFALAAAGAKVGILDADIHGPSMMLMSGAERPTETQGQMVVPPVVAGIKVISASMFNEPGQANIMRGPMTSQVIKQFLTQILWGELDYLLIDFPPGTGDIQLSLAQIADITGVVMVTTPQEAALIDVRKAVEMCNMTKVPILGFVETMSYFICDGCDKKHYLFGDGGGAKTAKELGLKLLGQIPLDAAATRGSDQGQPIVQSDPDHVVSAAFKKVAGEVAARVALIKPQA